MRRFLLSTAFVTVAAGLAACDSQGPVEKTAANRAFASPTKSADASDTAKPAEDFRSAVTPKSGPSGAVTADAELGEKVKHALISTRDVDIGGIQVAAAGGVVTLYGTVDVPAEKDRATLLALGVDGVRSVVNNLVVIRGS